MGMIPILLALCGFVLLWAIVNYNSLLSKQSQIQALSSKIEILFNQRKENILGVKNLLAANQVEVSAYLDQLEYLPQNRSLQNEEMFKDQRQKHFATIQNHPDFIDLITILENTDREIFMSQRKLRQLSSDYNQQVNQMPSKIVALLFGFKPVSISST